MLAYPIYRIEPHHNFCLFLHFTLAFLYLTGKELASRIQKAVTVRKIKNDKGKIPFLEYYIYTRWISTLMTILTHHRLCPVPSELLDMIAAPDFPHAVNYTIERNANSKQDFKKLHKVIFKK